LSVRMGMSFRCPLIGKVHAIDRHVLVGNLRRGLESLSRRTAHNPVIYCTLASCNLFDNNRSRTIHWHFWNTFCRFGASDLPNQKDTLNQTFLVAY
jgi:hypothetical protein